MPGAGPPAALLLLLLLLLTGSPTRAAGAPQTPTPSPSPSPGSQCDLVGEAGSESEAERGLLRKLEPLLGIGFQVTSSSPSGEDSYTYSFKLCESVNGEPNAGLTQQNDKTKKVKVIGRYNATQLIGGSDWIFLIYGNGDQYATHCEQENRRSMVMISCNPDVLGASFSVIMEERAKESNCFYLFELDSRTVCPSVTHQLSTGSILLIVFLVLVTVYILAGFLYQRLVIGAKGVGQFPNYSFWQDIGSLSADGCDFVCRSKPRNSPALYRGVGDEQLEEEEERDEQLLPM